jgi:hypothetical protein
MSVFCNLGRTPWVYRAFSYQRLFADAEKGPMQIAPGQSDICEYGLRHPRNQGVDALLVQATAFRETKNDTE